MICQFLSENGIIMNFLLYGIGSGNIGHYVESGTMDDGMYGDSSVKGGIYGNRNIDIMDDSIIYGDSSVKLYGDKSIGSKYNEHDDYGDMVYGDSTVRANRKYFSGKLGTDIVYDYEDDDMEYDDSTVESAKNGTSNSSKEIESSIKNISSNNKKNVSSSRSNRRFHISANSNHNSKTNNSNRKNKGKKTSSKSKNANKNGKSSRKSKGKEGTNGMSSIINDTAGESMNGDSVNSDSYRRIGGGSIEEIYSIDDSINDVILNEDAMQDDIKDVIHKEHTPDTDDSVEDVILNDNAIRNNDLHGVRIDRKEFSKNEEKGGLGTWIFIMIACFVVIPIACVFGLLAVAIITSKQSLISSAFVSRNKDRH